MSYRWAIAIAALLTAGPATALSLEEALAIAREQATTLRSLAAETEQAKALHQQSAQAFLPVISADSSWLRADSSLITGVPVPSPGSPTGIRPTDFGPVEGTLTGVQIIQPIFNADALGKRNAADLNVDARRHAQQWGRQALRLEVARRYYNILRLQELERAAGVSLTATETAARLARSSYREGLASRLDVELASAERAAAVVRVIRAEAAVDQAEFELKSLLGLSPEQPMQLVDRLPDPMPPAGMGEPVARDDFLARQAAVEAAEAGIRAAKAEWIPRINFLARQQWIQGREPLDPHADGWLVAVNLEWTLFDGLGRQGRIAESRARARKSQAELEEIRRRIRKEQAISMTRWRAGFSGWQAAGKAVQAAETAARLAFRRYEEGIGSMTDLLASRARLTRERATLIDARYQAVLSGMNYHLQNGYDPLMNIRELYP